VKITPSPYRGIRKRRRMELNNGGEPVELYGE